MGKKRKQAIKQINKDKGELKAGDLLRISRKTGLKLGQLADIASRKTDKTVEKSTIKSARKKRKVSEAKKEAARAAAKVKDIPSGIDGRSKPFVKYKPQPEALEEAAEAQFKVKKAKGLSKPKTLKGTGKILEKFKKGRAARKASIKGMEKEVKRPDYAEYESRVKDIQEGKGDAASYAYSGKFQDLGKKLGVGYSPGERQARTASRFEKLTSGLKSAYETPAQSRERRRGLGKKAMEAMRIS